MFDSIRGLDSKIKLSIPVERDDKGFFDRQCPADHCKFLFKVKWEHWRDHVKDEKVFCPQCRHAAPASEWMTKAQTEHLVREGTKQVMGILGQAFTADAARFNSRQRRGFITMSMTWHGPQSRPPLIPVPAAEAMQLEVTCAACGVTTAVVGSAFFCPCCGDNAVERVFDDAMRKIIVKVDQIDSIRHTLTATLGADEATLTCRSLLESCLQEGVSSFQRLADVLYARFPGVTSVPKNVFQRLTDGSNLWRAASGQGYDAWLTPEELRHLGVLFQKRHLLAHKDGMVDDEYVRKSGDTTYSAGQRLVVSDTDARMLVSLVNKLASGVRSSAP